MNDRPMTAIWNANGKGVSSWSRSDGVARAAGDDEDGTR